MFSLFITDLIEGLKGRGAGRTVARQEFGWKGAIAETRRAAPALIALFC